MAEDYDIAAMPNEYVIATESAYHIFWAMKLIVHHRLKSDKRFSHFGNSCHEIRRPIPVDRITFKNLGIFCIYFEKSERI